MEAKLIDFLKKIINSVNDNEDAVMTLLSERFDNIISESKLTDKFTTEENFFNVYTYGYIYSFTQLASEHAGVKFTEKLLFDFCNQKLIIHFNNNISLSDEIKKALSNEGPHGAFEFKKGEEDAITDFLKYYFKKNTHHQTCLYKHLSECCD